MNKDTLLKNLKLLSNLEAGGTPAHSWRSKNREIFLMQVQNSRQNLPVKEDLSWREQAADYVHMFFDSAWMRRNVFRPSLIALSSLAVVLSGWIASVSASIDSVPGDMLYPLKRATEAAQLTLSPGAESKTNLQVEFAARRLDEVSKITEAPVAVNNDANVQYAVQEFKNNMNDVKDNLDALKESASPETVAAVAKMVDRKTDEYATQLDKASDSVSDSVKVDMQSAKNAVEETGVKAVELMVAHTTSLMTMDELKKKLTEKIVQLESHLNTDDTKPAVTSTLSDAASADAKKSLESAHLLLDQDNLLAALQEVKNATKLILGDSSVASTSTPPVLPETVVDTTPASTTPKLNTETTSTDHGTVNIQFVPDTTSLDWLEAQIMEQDFKPNDKPSAQDDITTITH